VQNFSIVDEIIDGTGDVFDGDVRLDPGAGKKRSIRSVRRRLRDSSATFVM
jgi:hypothetical protein